jgi:hypothetical protein
VRSLSRESTKYSFKCKINLTDSRKVTIQRKWQKWENIAPQP